MLKKHLVIIVSSLFAVPGIGFADPACTAAAPIRGLAANAPPVVTPGLPWIPGVKIVPMAEMDPPFSSKEVEDHKKVFEQGYYLVSDESIDNFKLSAQVAKFVEMTALKSCLTSPLSNMDSLPGPFSKMKLEGVIPSRQLTDGRWAQIERWYSLPNGALLSFTELDVEAAGDAVWLGKESINETVNGAPATLIARKNARGDAVTRLSWSMHNKYYTLQMSGHVRGLGNENLLVKLASSIQQL